jgi:hypothetical protein
MHAAAMRMQGSRTRGTPAFVGFALMLLCTWLSGLYFLCLDAAPLQSDETAISKTKQSSWQAISMFSNGLPHIEKPAAPARRNWTCAIQ